MRMSRLGDTGPLLPCVGLGTWRRFDLPPQQEHRARELVDLALDLGVRIFDTAPVYGRAEEVLARSLSGNRQRAFVATKIWSQDSAGGRRQFDHQLRLFDGWVDLLQIHHLIGWRTHARWLQDQRRQGRIGLLGLTYWRDHAFGGGTAAELEEAMRTGIFDTVQIPLNPVERAVEDRILPLAAELGIGVLVMRPFAEGDLLNRRPGPASAPHMDDADALLRWGLSDPRVHVTLPATLDPDHLRANVAAGGKDDLTDRQRAAIGALHGPPSLHR